jgi:hypothetical protein|tara:strand:+ start:460 stop:702 length:243 start_codon:yes stop_codon:yes gene_type:complete
MNEKERALNTQVEIRDGEGWYKGRYMIVRINPDGSEVEMVHCADKKNALCYKNHLLSKMQSDLYGYLARNMGKGVRSVKR